GGRPPAGYPVVVKSAKPGAHKTERGRIALDLHDADEVRQAAERIGGPLLVQPMVRGGAELLAGATQDPVFGPLVAFGPGGVLAELIGEAQFRIAPLTDVDAEELVRTGKPGALVAGFRGAPPSDASALAELVLRLSRLAESLPEVAELDLNPVMGLPRGCVVVDARVRVARVVPVHRLKTWEERSSPTALPEREPPPSGSGCPRRRRYPAPPPRRPGADRGRPGGRLDGGHAHPAQLVGTTGARPRGRGGRRLVLVCMEGASSVWRAHRRWASSRPEP
ncbi:MAG: hypothetical protein C4306_09955, partial [Thermoleophilia bacterium]